MKFSLKCCHRACFERSYFHSIAGLISLCSFDCESHVKWIRFDILQPPSFTSKYVRVRERERKTDRHRQFLGVREKHRVPPFLPNNRVLCVFLKIKLDL